MTFEEVLRKLYSAPATDFVEQRKLFAQEAKVLGDAELAKRIASLRRPTAAAAVLNQLDEHQLNAVLQLGEELRDATSRLDSSKMLTLGARRAPLISEITSGLNVSATVRGEVSATLTAAIADPQAAQALASRALVKAIHYAGFGEVDLSDALASHEALNQRAKMHVVSSDDASDAERLRRIHERAQKRVDELTAAAEQAQHRHIAAQQALESARRAADSAQAGLQKAEAELSAAKASLADLSLDG